MARGKYLSLEEARKIKGGLKRFAKEHPSKADERFPKLLEAMARGLLEGGRTSDRAASEDCNETQTRRGISEDASG